METEKNFEFSSKPSEFIFLRIDEKTIKIRRSILIEHSLYMNELLKHKPTMCIVSLDNVDFSIFDMILRWIHKSEFEPELLSLTTAIELFNTALHLKIIGLLIICEKIIVKKFMDSDITDIYEFIEQEGKTDIFQTLHNILVSSFEYIAKYPKFMRFNIDFVCSLLSDNDIVIISEKVVLDAALKWLNYDWTNRQKYTLRVMSCVRMKLLSKQDLLFISLRSSEFPVLELPEVRKMFLNAFKYHAAVKTSQISCFPDLIPLLRTRFGVSNEQLNCKLDESMRITHDDINSKAVTIARRERTGDELNLNIHSGTCITPRCSFSERAGKDSLKTKPLSRSNLARWISSPMCTSRRPLPWQTLYKLYPHLNKEELAAVAIQAIFRGFRIRKKLKTINEAALKIQRFYRKWKQNYKLFSQISRVRKLESSAKDELSAGILVIGGLDPTHKPLATATTVFHYDARKNTWTPFCATPVPFVQSACAILDRNIYITGGIILPTRTTKKSISRANWCFNYFSKLWIRCCDMLETRTCHSLISHWGKLIAIGGKDSSGNLLKSTEFYEPHLDRWFTLSAMNIPRMAMASTIYQNSIWVCGGTTITTSDDYSLLTITETVECYHFNTNSWTSCSPLNIPRMSAMLVTLSNRLVLLGGASMDSVRLDVEEYDGNKDCWITNSALNMSRESAAVVTLFDLAFLIGGYSAESSKVLSSIQCFLPGLNGEVDSIASLPYPLNGHCAVAV